MKSEAEEIAPLKSSAKLASEYLLPGGSNLIKGDLVQGGLHAALGLIARTILGLPGLIAVSANSFTKATTGRHIHEHLCQVIGKKQKEQTSHQDASHNSYAEIKASDSSQSAHPLPQSAAERKQPSPRKRPSSSKTNKET